MVRAPGFVSVIVGPPLAHWWHGRRSCPLTHVRSDLCDGCPGQFFRYQIGGVAWAALAAMSWLTRRRPLRACATAVTCASDSGYIPRVRTVSDAAADSRGDWEAP